VMSNLVVFTRILQICTLFILFSTFRLHFKCLIVELSLLNNYFGLNMHKNALFLLKNGKNRPALRVPPPDPRQPLSDWEFLATPLCRGIAFTNVKAKMHPIASFLLEK